MPAAAGIPKHNNSGATARLEHVLTKGHGCVEVEEPGEEALRADHERRRERERLAGLAARVGARQSNLRIQAPWCQR